MTLEQPKQSIAPKSIQREHLSVARLLELQDMPAKLVPPVFELDSKARQRFHNDRVDRNPDAAADPMVLVELTTNTLNLALCSGQAIGRGTTRLRMPKSCFEQTMRDLGPDEQYAERYRAARQHYVHRQARLILDSLARHPRWANVSLAQVTEMMLSDDPDSEFQTASKEIASTIGNSSISASWQELYPCGRINADGSVERAMPVITSGRIISEGDPHPTTHATHNKKLSAAISEAITANNQELAAQNKELVSGLASAIAKALEPIVNAAAKGK